MSESGIISWIILVLLSFMKFATFWSNGESISKLPLEALGRGREGNGGPEAEGDAKDLAAPKESVGLCAGLKLSIRWNCGSALLGRAGTGGFCSESARRTRSVAEEEGGWGAIVAERGSVLALVIVVCCCGAVVASGVSLKAASAADRGSVAGTGVDCCSGACCSVAAANRDAAESVRANPDRVESGAGGSGGADPKRSAAAEEFEEDEDAKSVEGSPPKRSDGAALGAPDECSDPSSIESGSSPGSTFSPILIQSKDPTAAATRFKQRGKTGCDAQGG